MAYGKRLQKIIVFILICGILVHIRNLIGGVMTAQNQRKTYTWKDFQEFPNKEQFEMIDGEILAMCPFPSVKHQDLVLGFGSCLKEFFKAKSCKPFMAPLDVKLSDSSVVQPDVFVVCESGKIKNSHIDGAPDLAIEVVSPTSIAHDRMRKLHLYARHGVKEYWIVSTNPGSVEVLSLQESGHYLIDHVYSRNDILKSPLFANLQISLKTIFPDDLVFEVHDQFAEYRI